MIFAQIKDNVVKNCIVLENENLATNFQNGFDQILRIDNLEQIPGIGWSYDVNNQTFTSPPPPPSEE